jgi:hypothetical protein
MVTHPLGLPSPHKRLTKLIWTKENPTQKSYLIKKEKKKKEKQKKIKKIKKLKY